MRIPHTQTMKGLKFLMFLNWTGIWPRLCYIFRCPFCLWVGTLGSGPFSIKPAVLWVATTSLRMCRGMTSATSGGWSSSATGMWCSQKLGCWRTCPTEVRCDHTTHDPSSHGMDSIWGGQKVLGGWPSCRTDLGTCDQRHMALQVVLLTIWAQSKWQ